MSNEIFQMENVGEIIRNQRKNKNLLLRQVAAMIDIDQAILSKIERGERKADREIIIKLANILEIDKNDLLIQFLSEKIAYEIMNEEMAMEVLIVAEKKVQYLKKNKI